MLQRHRETITAPPVPTRAVTAQIPRENQTSANKPDVSPPTAVSDSVPSAIANAPQRMPEPHRPQLTPISALETELNIAREEMSKIGQPTFVRQPMEPKTPHALNRFSVRLENSELEALHKIIVQGIQGLGERITASDVFRVGLSRVGKGAPITSSEIATLRTGDGRRHKLNHAGETGVVP